MISQDFGSPSIQAKADASNIAIDIKQLQPVAEISTVPIYILAGQSNAAYFGLDAALVSRLRDIGGAYELVKVAIPGTRLAPDTREKGDWSPHSRGELFDRLVAAVRQRMAYVRSRGFEPELKTAYWVQGEADARTLETAQAYRHNLQELFASLRRALDAPDLHIVISRLTDQSPLRYDNLVRSAQDETARLDGHSIVNTSDLQLIDGLHYNLFSRFELGRRLVEAGVVGNHDVAGYTSLTSAIKKHL